MSRHDFRPHRLHEISIELTSKCNLTCEMCSVWKGKKDGISKDLVFSLLQEARHLGARVFTPSGAEVFMRKDTVEILAEAARLGFTEISVVNNGMLIAHNLEALRAIPGLALHVSLDGPEHIHDSLRGPGSYKKALEGARLAQGAGIPVSLKCVLMKPTMATAHHLIGLAAEHGFRRVSYQPFQPEIAGPDEDHAPWIFPESDRAMVATALEDLLAAGRIRGIEIYTESLFKHIIPYLFDGVRPLPSGGCYLPARFLLIDGRGETFPCFFMRGQSMGNVTQGVRLRDIWHGPVQQMMQSYGIRGTCPGCLAGCSDVAGFAKEAKQPRPTAA